MYRYRSIDCALLTLPVVDPDLYAALASRRIKPVQVHRRPLVDAIWSGATEARSEYDAATSQVLVRAAPALLRFDVCLLPVVPESLAWTRAALAASRGALAVPLILLASGLTAPALRDLEALGAADFVLPDAHPEELKARLMRWAVHGMRRRSAAVLATPAADVGAAAATAAAPSIALQEDSAAVLYACGPSSSPPAFAEHGSYRATRARVLADFERAYVVGMLVQYRGNVTHAARAGRQDRRAFWHLMRKYQILSADYRGEGKTATAPCR